MSKKIYSTAKELKIRAAEIAGGQISNKESFHEAVKLAIQIEAMRKNLMTNYRYFGDLLKQLNLKTSNYAIETKTALADDPLHTEREGLTQGSFIEGDQKFTLSLSPGDFKRISGDNMTQGFLGGLPDGWAAAKMMLDTAFLKEQKFDAETLAKHDLCQETARRWTMRLCECAEAPLP